MRKFLASLAALVAVVGFVAWVGPASAAVIYQDDFQSYDISGGPIDIVGQVAPTGQTYGTTPGLGVLGVAGDVPSLQVRSDAGIGSTQGVGSVAPGSGAFPFGFRAATVPLGATYTTGIYTLSADFKAIAPGQSPQFFLSSHANLSGTNLSEVIEGSPLHLALQGLGLGNINLVNFASPADVRVVSEINLDLKEVKVSWQGLDAANAAVSGSHTQTFAPAFTFGFLHILNAPGTGAHGFDNISLIEGVIPEPSGIVLLGLGIVGLAGLVRSRRRQG